VSSGESTLQANKAVVARSNKDVIERGDAAAACDLVATRKTLRGTHRGELLDISPTGKTVVIQVIDIVRVRNGQYVEHWGITTLPSVLAQLRGG
jgi:predicted ester cyclase